MVLVHSFLVCNIIDCFRLDTIAQCDMVFVIDDGKLLEIGVPSSLESTFALNPEIISS